MAKKPKIEDMEDLLRELAELSAADSEPVVGPMVLDETPMLGPPADDLEGAQ